MLDLSSIGTAFSTALKFINKAFYMSAMVGDRSYNDLTRLTKVEPLVILSKECQGLEIMPDLMQGLLKYTISDYSQALGILGNVQNVEVVRMLDKLNPSRDATSLLLQSFENRPSTFSLPTEHTSTLRVTNESRDGDDTLSLAVGKEVSMKMKLRSMVSNKDGEQVRETVDMPIAFRLIPKFISSAQITRILGHGTDDTGFVARWNRMRDGGITTFVDFIMAQDLIDQARHAMIKDDTRTLQTILNRVTTSKKIGMLTNNPSLANISNIFIITESEKISLESQFGGKMETSSVRNRMFDNVYASLIVIIDRNWNNVQFWHRGYDQPSTVSFKELRTGGTKGADIMEQLKSFNMGIPPNF